ncbi:DUF3011 domain-containing protein [Crocosphaera sp. UHCC 0190]|uniref:DUF3011 domain-containing protein n=1 Tax=Crocosphaera sp. UHCC 0190 TaxID=3110246 RepID=UPI002B20B087|nr:DUF3011 domain-containing protein [Crocosphaera sp. UHCC 0190]MEA5512222.1 DUF3011 domain-containing protein [Crocosphaera sp. UHCC 0190]
MMIAHINQLTLIAGISLGLILRTIPVSAQQTVTCESYKYRYQFCRVNTRGGVRLVRQLSNTRCVQGETWDYDRDGIWVDKGCNAEFSVRGRDSGYNNNNSYNNNNNSSSGDGTAAAVVGGALVIGAIAAAIAGGSDDNSSNNNSSSDYPTITCNSKDNSYTLCPVDLRGRRAYLERQLSQAGCWEGDTWGYDREGVWVDGGCRGIFEIRG